MSNKYKHGDRVPTEVLAARLDELDDTVTKGRAAIDREFVMRIPAELDHCPDLVMSQAADRLREYLSMSIKMAGELEKATAS